jgi:hypothetical protein
MTCLEKYKPLIGNFQTFPIFILLLYSLYYIICHVYRARRIGKIMSLSLTYEVHRFGKDHELQRVGVWTSPDTETQSKEPWIM